VHRPAKRFIRVNYQINAKELRLIDEAGNAAGVVKREDALARSKAVGLDLVEIVAQSVPPVCRIIDFHKYKYEQEKKEREQRKKHRAVEQKEIRFSPVISEHDYNFKKEHIREFLKEGNRVKVLVRFRGRQNIHPERGREILDRLTKELAEVAVVERSSRFEGGAIDIIMRPV
jgi:translation initiation factor IF-3